MAVKVGGPSPGPRVETREGGSGRAGGRPAAVPAVGFVVIQKRDRRPCQGLTPRSRSVEPRARRDRTSIILEPEDFDVWLDLEFGSQALTPLLQPWRGKFAVDGVSKAVNSPKNEGPELLATAG
jgi:hypothetical protein